MEESINPIEPNMLDLLGHALGSGEQAGAVNFPTLRIILESILSKLNISHESGKPAFSENYFHSVSNRIDNLENQLAEFNRPRSPSTLIAESGNGTDVIRSDWEVTKLRKRVDANEEGVSKALSIMDKLVSQIQDVKNDLDQTKERLKSEQEAQDSLISANTATIADLKEKVDTLGDNLTALVNKPKSEHIIPVAEPGSSNEPAILEKLAEHDSKLRALDKEMSEKVSWKELDNSFSVDFFDNAGAKKQDDLCAERRTEFSSYFDGLEALSELGCKIDEMLRDGSESVMSNQSAGPKTTSTMRVIETYTVDDKDSDTKRTVFITEQQKSVTHKPLSSNMRLSAVPTSALPPRLSSSEMKEEDVKTEPSATRISETESAVDVVDLLKENEELRHMMSKRGSTGNRRKSMFSRKSIVDTEGIPSLVSLNERIRECEMYNDHAQQCFIDHDEALDDHAEKIERLLKLKDEVDRIFHDMSAFNRYMEENSTRPTSQLDDDTILNIQKKMSGTERELSRLADLMQGLSTEGDQKSDELEQLQQLLRDLQDRAAMRDVVMDDLERKANTEDLEGMLHRDDLDATAQAIVNQLQDVINKQASAEAYLQSSINEVGAKLEESTMKDEFDPFKNEMEERLRQLRKRIENSKKEQNGLQTADGAAGFRKQLFNCISCSKNLSLALSRPILPEPSAFPARVSLRPHFGQAPAHHFFYSQILEESRSRPKSAYAAADGDGKSEEPIAREHTSHYSTLLAEREKERKRKRIENKIRQEINPYSFQSGIFPRQAGGRPQKLPEPSSLQIHKDKEEQYERLHRSKSLNMEREADLEGTDGHLYRGRLRALPKLKQKSKDKIDSADPIQGLHIANAMKNTK